MQCYQRPFAKPEIMVSGICLNLGNKYCMALAEYSVAFLEPTTPNVLGMLIIGGHLGKIGQTDNHKFLLIVEDN